MKRARRPQRVLRRTGLVVTEGKLTEPQYLQRLRQELAASVVAAVSFRTVGQGQDPLRVVRAVREIEEEDRRRGREYDWRCCVVDVDSHATLGEALRRAADERIHVVVSNPRFEIWLLWHAVVSAGFKSGPELDRILRERGLLLNKDLGPRFPVGSHPGALHTAALADPEQVDGRQGPNPSSSMAVLIDLLLGGTGGMQRSSKLAAPLDR